MRGIIKKKMKKPKIEKINTTGITWKEMRFVVDKINEIAEVVNSLLPDVEEKGCQFTDGKGYIYKNCQYIDGKCYKCGKVLGELPHTPVVEGWEKEFRVIARKLNLREETVSGVDEQGMVLNLIHKVEASVRSEERQRMREDVEKLPYPSGSQGEMYRKMILTLLTNEK